MSALVCSPATRGPPAAPQRLKLHERRATPPRASPTRSRPPQTAAAPPKPRPAHTTRTAATPAKVRLLDDSPVFSGIADGGLVGVERARRALSRGFDGVGAAARSVAARRDARTFAKAVPTVVLRPAVGASRALACLLKSLEQAIDRDDD
jgi:hypothetical protein